ncbi:hypothetical protein EV126DRAFT_357723 [Verticillium dahliae]|nr:hypothetical protein EV126DRAFT_357723 [Verticillium dahliae]
MSDTKRHTRFIEEPSSIQVGPAIAEPDTARSGGVLSPKLHRGAGSPTQPEKKPTLLRPRGFPVKPTIERHEAKLVNVFTGSPWNQYDVRYRINLGYSFGVVIPRDTSHARMIRTITGPNIEEQLQRFRQLCHSNIVKTVEIYNCFHQEDNFLVSELMLTSLRHICRSPIYPTEQQLSSILHQVLSGEKFLLENNLVHEQLSAANILVNYAGEVKISDIESCRRDGDGTKLLESFSRLMMKLMDKEKSVSAAIGLSHPDNWSHEAIDMFTTAVSKPGVNELLDHGFLQKRKQTELVWLVPLVLISAKHDRQ